MKNTVILGLALLLIMVTSLPNAALAMGQTAVYNDEQTLDCEPMDDGGYDCKDDIP